MRFLQPDSIIPDQFNPQSWNRYSYVRNNPILFNDPTGHLYCSADLEADECGFINETNNKITRNSKGLDLKTKQPDFGNGQGGGSGGGGGTPTPPSTPQPTPVQTPEFQGTPVAYETETYWVNRGTYWVTGVTGGDGPLVIPWGLQNYADVDVPRTPIHIDLTNLFEQAIPGYKDFIENRSQSNLSITYKGDIQYQVRELVAVVTQFDKNNTPKKYSSVVRQEVRVVNINLSVSVSDTLTGITTYYYLSPITNPDPKYR
jgi:hypothetical protein